MFRILTSARTQQALSLLVAGLVLVSASAEARTRHQPRRRAQQGGACAQVNPNKPAQLPAKVTANRGIDLRVQPSLVEDAGRIATSPATARYNEGGVLTITSGYRDCRRNAGTRGSAKNSAHLRGHAIDIRSHVASPYTYAMAIQAAGLHKPGGYYNTCVPHVHLDTEHAGFRNECGGKGNFRRHPRRHGRR